MAKYPATATLKKATPKVRTADNVVKSWDIEVLFTHTRADKTTWSRSYPHTEDVEYLNKIRKQANNLIKEKKCSWSDRIDECLKIIGYEK